VQGYDDINIYAGLDLTVPSAAPWFVATLREFGWLDTGHPCVVGFVRQVDVPGYEGDRAARMLAHNLDEPCQDAVVLIIRVKPGE
jgi:hypothetical protein